MTIPETAGAVKKTAYAVPHVVSQIAYKGIRLHFYFYYIIILIIDYIFIYITFI